MAYRSLLEARVSEQLTKANIPFLYEASKYDYVLTSNYTPDFFLPNGIILEVKGFFKPSDRRKMLAVKKAHPELDIRFVFQRDNKITRTSKTSYTDWATKYGFPCCVFPNIPSSWFDDNPT